MESELEFDDFSSGSEFEDAEGTCQNVEVFSSPSSDIKSHETGTFSLHLIQKSQLQRLSNVKIFSLGLTLTRTPQKFSFIDQNADLENSSLMPSSSAECWTSREV